MPILFPDANIYGVLGGIVIALVILVWWMFFSRATWTERIGVIVLMAIALGATSQLVHESIRGGMMGMMLSIYAIPGLALALVAWAAASRRLARRYRWVTLAAFVLFACGVWTLLRTDGITGEGTAQLAWRWSRTPEQRLLARATDTPTGASATPVVIQSGADWPGFRGPHR